MTPTSSPYASGFIAGYLDVLTLHLGRPLTEEAVGEAASKAERIVAETGTPERLSNYWLGYYGGRVVALTVALAERQKGKVEEWLRRAEPRSVTGRSG